MISIIETPKIIELKRINEWKSGKYNYDNINPYELDRYALKNNMTPKEVIEKLKTNEIDVSGFLKKPHRQNIGEELFKNYMINTTAVNESEITILPKSGKNAGYLCGDKILFGSKTDLANIISFNTHSLDIKIVRGQNTYYISHKIINNTGGTQNSQYDEMKNFIKESNKINEGNIFVGVVINGDYFNKKRVNELNSLITNNNVFVYDYNEIVEKFLTI
jgi:hypothetical protein